MRRIDLSPLRPQGPTPTANLFSGLGGIIADVAARRRREQELAAEQAAKAQELQFRRDQESRLVARQEAQDKQAEARATAQAQRDQQAQNIKGYEAVSKAKTPQERAFLAQLYGGTVEQAKPDYSAGPDDPLGTIDFLENVEEDDSSPLGFSYGINPEHERRTQQAARTQVMTMPGGQPINLPDPAEEEDHFTRLERQISMLPPGSLQQQDALMRLREARALQLDPKATYGSMQDGRTMAQREALARKRGGGGGGAPKPGQVADDARADMNSYLSNQGYKADVATMKQFQRMESAANEAAKGNAAAARVFMGMFVKFAQGEVGVLNASDMDIFWNQAGSPKERSEEALAKLVSGGLGEAKQRAAIGAIQALMQTAKDRKETVYQGAADYMQKYGPEGERHLKAYFGKGYPTAEGAGNAVGTPRMLMKPADMDRLNRIKVR